MSIFKKSESKSIDDDIQKFINQSQFLKTSPTNKKNKKRLNTNTLAEDQSAATNVHLTISKKKKIDGNVEVCRELRQKLLTVMNQQLESRKKIYNNYQKNLLEVRHILEADYNISKDNEQKFEKLIGVFLKSMQQTTNAQKDHIETISQISESFKKEVEGLLTRGAMKPDDRPLWFDVYRALPPITEPKFARPKPEKKPIRPILYKEDIIRAKFHANSNGLSSNMLSPGGETHTRRLVQQYIKLESKGVPESKLIEKSVAAVSSERQLESKIMSKNPDSVTSQVLVEADLKNIFKE